jgi:uncharacterized protein YfkK (UPF0435 family)
MCACNVGIVQVIDSWISSDRPDYFAKIRQIDDIEFGKRRNELPRSPSYSKSINTTLIGVKNMTRQKRSSSTVVYAERRLVALESIDLALNLGDDLTIESLAQSIEATRTKLKTYNAALTEIDQLKDTLQEQERSLEKLIERMTSGVAAKYGKTSQEYKAVSDVRKSPRRNSTKVQPIQSTELSA